jgi:hypothetical protein
MARTIFLGIAALLSGLLAGCSTVDSRIKADPTTFAALSPADQTLVRRGAIRQGMSKAAVYLAWGKPDRIRTGVRAGNPFEAWTYTTVQSTIDPYPGFYGFGYYRYGWHGTWGPYGRYRGFYGIYPYDPYPDVISYEVPYKTVFFENGRCVAWEIIR